MWTNWLKYIPNRIVAKENKSTVRSSSLLLIVILSSFLFSFAEETSKRECIEQWNLRNIGIREEGYNRGKFIEYVQKLCNTAIGNSYCSCYVNAGFMNCNVEGLPVGSAWSPSWFYYRDKNIYKRGNFGNFEDWKTGDVFGLFYENLKRIGHVGFIMYVKKGYIISAEANTSDDGNKWNPGEGIHMKKRSIKQIYMVSNFISSSTANNDIVYHYVSKKETVFSIARKYNVTVEDLVQWNNIENNIIYLGQKLTIKTDG